MTCDLLVLTLVHYCFCRFSAMAAYFSSFRICFVVAGTVCLQVGSFLLQQFNGSWCSSCHYNPSVSGILIFVLKFFISFKGNLLTFAYFPNSNAILHITRFAILCHTQLTAGSYWNSLHFKEMFQLLS